MLLNKSDFLSESYIKNVLSTGKWSYHGSDLNDWLEDCEDVPATYQGGDIFELKNKQEFIVFFKGYLSLRFDYAIKFLSRDLSGINPLKLNRAILVTKDFTENLEIGGLYDFGQYWSTQHTIPYGAKPDENKKDLFLVCEVERHQIDLYATMQSRMDYIHGDYEMEIKTKTGEKVKLISFN